MQCSIENHEKDRTENVRGKTVLKNGNNKLKGSKKKIAKKIKNDEKGVSAGRKMDIGQGIEQRQFLL